MNDRLLHLIQSFESALKRLNDALRQPKTEFTRDSAIQRFEIAFELMWKSLKAFSVSAGVPVHSPKESFRSAFQLGIVEESPLWFSMLEDRNMTTHTYDEAMAERIYSHLNGYLPLLEQALRKLRDEAEKE